MLQTFIYNVFDVLCSHDVRLGSLTQAHIEYSANISCIHTLVWWQLFVCTSWVKCRGSWEHNNLLALQVKKRKKKQSSFSV